MDVTESEDGDHTERQDGNGESGHEKSLRYTLTRRPPLSVIIGGGLQHVMMCLPTALTLALIVADGVCAAHDSPLRTKLFSSTLLMCGICTIIQTALGVRLPIFQGPSSVFISVILAVQKQDMWKCTDSQSANMSQEIKNMSTLNSTFSQEPNKLTQSEKLRQLSGSLMAASLVEVIIGATGLVGFFLRFVGPITVAPTIALLGLSLYRILILFAKPSWELALTGSVLVIVFVSYLGHLKIPIPTSLRNCRSCKRGSGKHHSLQLFQLIPILLSILVVWSVSGILTHFNVFPSDPSHSRYTARKDAKSHLIQLAPWFHIPHPGQFGIPSFNLALFIGFIGVTFASLIESVGDYFAAAKACEVMSPPNHAVNRGILMEGIGGVLSGALGVGHATTSYSGNIAAMTLTKTANRTVMYSAGFIMILLSVIEKFGAALVTIPDPALGGALAVIFGMLISIGLSTLQYVNLNSSRNLLILGMAFITGILIPEWLDRDPNLINTGITEVDNVLKIFLGTPMILGGIIAVLLDNTTKGSRNDRGIDAWQKNHRHGMTRDNNPRQPDMSRDTGIYGWTCQIFLHKYVPWCFKLPFMPNIQAPAKWNGAEESDISLESVGDGTC